MCGRFSLAPDLGKLQLRFRFQISGLSYTPRYNITPTQEVFTVTNDGSENRAQLMKWGLYHSGQRTPLLASG